MNLRLDEHSVRLRLSAADASCLLAEGAIKQVWSVAGADLELQVLLCNEVQAVEVSFDLPLCVVRVKQSAFEHALQLVPARDAGVYARSAEGHEFALEIDSFSAKGKRAESLTKGKL